MWEVRGERPSQVDSVGIVPVHCYWPSPCRFHKRNIDQRLWFHSCDRIARVDCLVILVFDPTGHGLVVLVFVRRTVNWVVMTMPLQVACSRARRKMDWWVVGRIPLPWLVKERRWLYVWKERWLTGRRLVWKDLARDSSCAFWLTMLESFSSSQHPSAEWSNFLVFSVWRLWHPQKMIGCTRQASWTISIHACCYFDSLYLSDEDEDSPWNYFPSSSWKVQPSNHQCSTSSLVKSAAMESAACHGFLDPNWLGWCVQRVQKNEALRRFKCDRMSFSCRPKRSAFAVGYVKRALRTMAPNPPYWWQPLLC